MKIKLFITTVFMALSIFLKAQVSFGVSPGLNLNTAYLGYKSKKIMPLVGFQYFGATLTTTEDSETDKTSIKIFVLNAGLKYFFKDGEKLKSYVLLSVCKPFVSNTNEYNGQGSDSYAKSNLIGAEGGFGAEYMFDPHFSIGGEFGLRYMNIKSKQTYSDNVPNQPDITYSSTLSIAPTYTKICLNYYF